MLRPGKHDDSSADTMAKAIEAAFVAEWPHFTDNKPGPDEETLQPMRLLFNAVAQGVVQHLRDHPEAFKLTVQSSEHAHSGGAHTHGDGSHSHSGGSHAHSASVSSIDTQHTTA